MANLQKYISHLEHYGPFMVLETAALDGEMTRKELAQLKAQIEYQYRTAEWRSRVQTDRADAKKKRMFDGKWTPKSDDRLEHQIRKCVGCGLDIPRSRGGKAKFHSQACKQRHYRKRIAEMKKEARKRAIQESRRRRSGARAD